ncbi:unnamed protein product [Diamesa hyperborea]
MTEAEMDIYLDKHTKKPALAKDLSQTKGWRSIQLKDGEKERKPSYIPERRPIARTPSRSRSRSGFPGLLNIMNPFAGYSQVNPNPVEENARQESRLFTMID